MSFSLTGKQVLITGATDGLGLATAKRLVREGAHIYLHGRTQEKVDEAVKEVQKENSSVEIKGIVCDLNETEKIVNAFSEIKKLDILINNAGIWHEGKSTDITSERIIELTKVNTLAPLLITHTLLPVLEQSEFGQIISIASIAGVEIPAGYYHTFYSAVKFALQGFSEGLAKEYFGKNLRIMGYYPGGMKTNFFKKAGMSYKSDESWMFDMNESVEAILFMLTRDKSINIKRMDLIKQ